MTSTFLSVSIFLKGKLRTRREIIVQVKLWSYSIEDMSKRYLGMYILWIYIAIQYMGEFILTFLHYKTWFFFFLFFFSDLYRMGVSIQPIFSVNLPIFCLFMCTIPFLLTLSRTYISIFLGLRLSLCSCALFNASIFFPKWFSSFLLSCPYFFNLLSCIYLYSSS
jgi:hypothetical protein